MIYGQLKNWRGEQAAISPVLRHAVEYLRTTDFARLSPGRYEIQGDNLFALVSEYQTQPRQERRPERHERYIDIQFLVSGQEWIGCCSFQADFRETENSLKEKDIVFYGDPVNEVYLPFVAGTYAIFFPSDIHRPCCANGQSGPVKKVVVKVAVNLLHDGNNL